LKKASLRRKAGSCEAGIREEFSTRRTSSQNR
jgi:hypothetical protein